MKEISNKIIDLVEQARQSVAKNTNISMIATYFIIGQLIVEEFQNGFNRAGYGDNLLIEISKELTKHFKRGFSVPNLERMRNFYQMYSKSSSELRNSDGITKLLPISKYIYPAGWWTNYPATCRTIYKKLGK